MAFSLLVALGGGTAYTTRSRDRVAPNDNRQAAGTLANGVLNVALEARMGSWRPEGDSGSAVEVAAFSEEGKPLSTPGPVIRVRLGTTVRATIRNRLDTTLVVYGFGETRGMSDSVVVPPKAVRAVSFTASETGTYYYLGKTGNDAFGGRLAPDGQLQGFIVVDAADAPADPNERLMGISWWCNVNPASRTGLSRCTMTINGLSWPHTERLEYTQGDSIHWRVANFTELDHPMHLHGFYFRMDSKGDGVQDSTYTPDQRRMAVTEVIKPFQTMSLAWKAERAGNWIYHCHYAAHLGHAMSLDTENGVLEETKLAHHASDRPHQMFGLVIGMHVAPKGVQETTTGPERRIRMLQREKPGVYGTQPGMSFVLDGTPEATDPQAMVVPAPLLVLERGQPVAVTIVNQSTQHAAVHWHGIELESYPDGVPGFSGAGDKILPSIAPNDSLTVRWTPPRAGSFMYHSHFNEQEQMGRGLYGPIVVVEPGARFDPQADRILFFGTAGGPENLVFGPYPDFLLNGKSQPEPMNLKAGTRYRFRLFNLAGDMPLTVSLNSGDTPVAWRAVAKDGYPLPASQATERPAQLTFDPGEIYDFEFTPRSKGEFTLVYGPPAFPPPPPAEGTAPAPPPGAAEASPFSPPPPTIKVAIRVR